MTAHLMQVCVHILRSLGLQQFPVQEGPVVTPKAYLPPLMFDIVGKLCLLFDATQQINPSEFLTLAAMTSFTGAVGTSMDLAYELHEHCLQHNGVLYDATLTALREKLNRTRIAAANAAISPLSRPDAHGVTYCCFCFSTRFWSRNEALPCLCLLC